MNALFSDNLIATTETVYVSIRSCLCLFVVAAISVVNLLGNCTNESKRCYFESRCSFVTRLSKPSGDVPFSSVGKHAADSMKTTRISRVARRVCSIVGAQLCLCTQNVSASVCLTVFHFSLRSVSRESFDDSDVSETKASVNILIIEFCCVKSCYVAMVELMMRKRVTSS